MPFAVRGQVAPVGALRRIEWRGHDLEVDGLIGIGENEQLVAAIGQRILHAIFALRDQARRRIGVFEIRAAFAPRFRGRRRRSRKTPAGTFMDMDEPAGVFFLVDQHIVRLRRAEAMAPDLQRPVVFVTLSHRKTSWRPNSTPRRRRFPRRGRRDRCDQPSREPGSRNIPNP